MRIENCMATVEEDQVKGINGIRIVEEKGIHAQFLTSHFAPDLL